MRIQNTVAINLVADYAARTAQCSIDLGPIFTKLVVLNNSKDVEQNVNSHEDMLTYINQYTDNLLAIVNYAVDHECHLSVLEILDTFDGIFVDDPSLKNSYNVFYNFVTNNAEKDKLAVKAVLAQLLSSKYTLDQFLEVSDEFGIFSGKKRYSSVITAS